MTAKNSYTTIKDLKNYIRSRGGSVQDDVIDDEVINFLLEASSRYIDSETSRYFFPLIETNYYNTPKYRELSFDGDVLEVLTLTNGNGVAISSTEYNIIPKNMYPKFGLRLKESTSTAWELDTDGDSEFVVALQSINGYHDRYNFAWESITTLAEVLDDSELGFDLTSAANIQPGHILRTGNEIVIVDSVSTNTVNVLERGGNGSTAAAHDNASAVSIWRPMADCRNACMEIAYSAYMRRFGSGNTNGTVSSSIEIEIRDVPRLSQDFIKKYRRCV